MGAGASALDGAKGKDAAAIAEGVGALGAYDKGLLLAALEAASGGDPAIATNIKNIAENEAQIHELRGIVMTNKQGIYEARSMIEENRANIIKNYAAAFVGNRQMANENTEAIMKNRIAILDAMKVAGPVQENFRNTKYNEAAVEYLENRSLLNNRVAKVNEQMSAANADLIAINEDILKSNEEIVAFNAAQIQTNTNLLAGVLPEKCTPEANATRIADNAAKIAKIKERNDKYNADMDNKHGQIKENRTNIEANAAAIKERRKDILKNRDAIQANNTKVAALIRGGVAGVEELTAKVAEMSDDEKKSLKDALTGGSEDAAVVANRKNITANEATLHKLHLDVLSNKSQLYAIRSVIEENRTLVLKNYAAAFIGNRQMANQNTDDIFKNRVAILDSLKIEGQVQENFRNTKYNEANIDFLEHRSLLNNRVAKVNAKMADFNTKLIEINKAIMAGNEETVKFNASMIETNTKLMDGIKDEKATPEANAARIESNTQRIKVIADRIEKYQEKVKDMLDKAVTNRSAIETNAKIIDERRADILSNRGTLVANGDKVVEMLRAQ